MLNKRFNLTQQHVDLLRRSNIEYRSGCEWGYIGLDCKRPFGNSDLVGNMARISGVKPIVTDDDERHWPPGTRVAMLKIFQEELPIALSVILASGSFTPGEYQADPYADNWRKV